MPAVDSNVIVRLIAQDNPQQTAAAAEFVEKGVSVSILALAEAIWVLRKAYQRDHSALIGILEKLLSNKHLILQDPDAVAAALELYRSKPSLGFSDCLILELPRKAGQLPLGTFDRGLARVHGTQKL